MKKDIVLDVKNLNVRLGAETILENLSFDVRWGEILTILGPNGAGKTVLLKTLLGIIPFQGTVEWQAGIKTAYVPQRLPFIKDIPMNVGEFFQLKNALETAIKPALGFVGLKSDILEKKIGNLSSGQFQRILVGWALISNPQVLLFDEPTTGIDIGGQESIYELLEKLHKERNLTIILITHDLSVVYKLATRCLCLNRKMLCYSSPSNLTADDLSRLYGGQIKLYGHTHE